MYFFISFRFRLDSRLGKLIENVNTLGNQVASHKLDGLKPSSFGFAEQMAGTVQEAARFIRCAAVIFRKLSSARAHQNERRASSYRHLYNSRIVDSPRAAKSVEAAVSAAESCPATNPVIADLRGHVRPYRDICGIPCSGVCVKCRIFEQALAAASASTPMARLARCRSAMVLEFEAGWNFPVAAQSTTYRATRLAEPPG